MKYIDIFNMSQDELLDLYGIELDENGTVYDPVEGQEFPSLAAWKAFTDQQEKASSHIQKFGGRWGFDDE